MEHSVYEYDMLKLENQLCFPLYAAAKEVVKNYRPYLEELDLTYTQYIAMLVFWEQRKCSVKDLGEKLYLDSGTLTPVLKSLEKKNYISRSRCTEDERVVIAEITPLGDTLREQARTIPEKVAGCVRLEPAEAQELYRLLYKILDSLRD